MWTSEPPQKSGYYWLRNWRAFDDDEPNNKAVIVSVSEIFGMFTFSFHGNSNVLNLMRLLVNGQKSQFCRQMNNISRKEHYD